MSAYDWYEEALAGNPVFHGEYLSPQAGYYKLRAVPWKTQIKPQNMEFEPIEICWQGETDQYGRLINDEFIAVTIRSYAADESQIDAIWRDCQQHPISFDQYSALLRGKE